jgi:hypothetical protein
MVFPVAQPAKANWKATVVYDEAIPPETQEGINKQFDKFISNSNMSVVKFTKATDTTEADMIIRVKDFKPVTPGQQVTGSIISFVGLFVTPLAILEAADGHFVAFFWYFPKSHTTSTMYVHDGEGNSNVRKKTYAVRGPGFWETQSGQRKRHSKGYRKYFKKVLKYYNEQVLTAKRKGLATTP